MTKEELIGYLEEYLGVGRISDSEIVYKGKHRLFTFEVIDNNVYLFRKTFYGRKQCGKPVTLDFFYCKERVSLVSKRLKAIADIPVYKQIVFDIKRFFGF